jgi:type II secretory pathway pseudopilin PulG
MRRAAAVLVAGAVLAVGAVGAGSAVAGAKGPAAKSIAAEICEPMVRNAVEASLGAPLPGAQQGAWAGRTFTCTYPLTGGQLVLAVDDLRTKAKAKSTYAQQNRVTAHATRLNGLGNGAFQAPDGTVLAYKDQFLLHINPTAAPPAVQKSDLAFAALVAVMSCWTGGT